MPRPPKKYRDLKPRQRGRIHELIYKELLYFSEAYGKLSSSEEEVLGVAQQVRNRHGVNVDFEDFYSAVHGKILGKIRRVEMLGIPEHIMIHEEKKRLKAARGPEDKQKRKKKKGRIESEEANPDQDGQFYFIAGYTSGGAPYGLTWEEMGLQPWEAEPEADGTPFINIDDFDEDSLPFN